MNSGHSYCSLDRPWQMPLHNFPNVICEDDDARFIQQEFGNTEGSFYHDVTHVKCDLPRSIYSHFPENICENNLLSKSLTDEFVKKKSNKVGQGQHYLKKNDHKTLDIMKVGNCSFPAIICEDDAEPICYESVCHPVASFCDRSTDNAYTESSNRSRQKTTSSASKNYSLNSSGENDHWESRTHEGVNEEKNVHFCDVIKQDFESNFCHDNDDQDDRLQESILNSLTKLEEAVFTKETHKLDIPKIYVNDATDLFSAHADLLNMDDPWKQLQQAVSSGRTIKLTEAGQQALLMIKPDPIILPFQSKNNDAFEDGINKFINDRHSHISTPKANSNRAETDNKNTCNTVMLRTESTDINGYARKEANIGEDKSKKCYENSNTNMDCDTSLQELDTNLQILSNLKASSRLKDLLKIQPVSGTLLYSEIIDIYKNMTSVEEE